ncbi:SanA/YdcF family protein [Paenibacillus thermotolerans]|uniref:SanA/YdcF family protein n=1 Tax=Paenibacillus thermotolerans TaxID=3027807 RepID=UPI002367B1E8|nr:MULTISPECIES: ElyC/SanA/YdcF family protein [unclassified Paenibacillus]
MKRRRVIAIYAAIAVLLAGAGGMFGINGWMKTASAPYIADAGQAPAADAILVLGARVYSETSVSPMLNDRLEQGLALYEAGKAPKIIVSGDHGTKAYDEVNAMRLFLEERGVPSEDIFMDHAGFSTYESAYRARDIFKTKSVIVVTQGYHLIRSVYVARRLGIDAYGVASDPRTYFGAEKYEAREKLARVKDFIFVHVTKPKPTYLGEAYPITGDGRVTHD